MRAASQIRPDALRPASIAGALGRRVLPRLALFDAQRGMLFCWIPVCLAIGIGGWFALPSDPTPQDWMLVAAGLGLSIPVMAAGAWRWPVVVGLVCILAGFALAGLRGQMVDAPVLGWRYYGPVEGRIVAIDRSASDKMRLTLDRVVLDRTSPARTPARVRVSLHGDQRWLDPAPGMVVIMTAHLGPPEGPVEPGGFDFQRMAWFDRLGAVGYTRTPALLLEGSDAALPIARLRRHISRSVQQILPGETGAFAAAILTGDRSGMQDDTLAALRAANTAHLLAISGLHMGLLTGCVFVALRTGMAAIPALALRHPIRKWAALGALAAGAFYLALSGGNVATQRAFVMAAVMLGAILLDRRALTLRAVAVAAIIVLVLRPEELTGPGFQMSFAATVALVAAFRGLRGWLPPGLPRWGRAVIGLVVSSAVAGAATAPIAAAHFNQLSQLGLAANLASVPLMGAVVMPAAVLAACLTPLGLGWIGLAIMAPAIDWILWIAHTIGGMDGALRMVPSPGPWVLPLVALGALWWILWQGRGRWAGLLPLALAASLWGGVERPDLLISPDGALIGLDVGGQRALNKPKGQGFVASNWLENDGDRVDQAQAAERPGLARDADGLTTFSLGGQRIAHIAGRNAAERAAAACGRMDIVIMSGTADGPDDTSKPHELTARCEIIDATTLRRTGAIAMWAAAEGDGLHRLTVRDASGRRAWNATAWRSRASRDQ
ncbi:competence protein [Oceaniovalibus guishaninsula JLT2003]|uniref:Competence protein n=1 Tax=Oceaniovalibus guishaninsula JLT2003 TaxID=1231392 RepID=K2I4A7_9RHOB|nr:ComEC/Rec2 family competence protein [Oceaniovalibus guishaninsula]EKE43680.1 competence protein [Oceaniovalibus guishaninsula JLT2003]